MLLQKNGVQLRHPCNIAIKSNSENNFWRPGNWSQVQEIGFSIGVKQVLVLGCNKLVLVDGSADWFSVAVSEIGPGMNGVGETRGEVQVPTDAKDPMQPEAVALYRSQIAQVLTISPLQKLDSPSLGNQPSCLPRKVELVGLDTNCTLRCNLTIEILGNVEKIMQIDT